MSETLTHKYNCFCCFCRKTMKHYSPHHYEGSNSYHRVMHFEGYKNSRILSIFTEPLTIDLWNFRLSSPTTVLTSYLLIIETYHWATYFWYIKFWGLSKKYFKQNISWLNFKDEQVISSISRQFYNIEDKHFWILICETLKNLYPWSKLPYGNS